MAHKQVLFRSAAREKMLRGATQLADAVRVTLGPRSKSVLIQKKWGAPIVCNDGVTIAKEFDLKDPEENLGAQMLRQAAEKTGDVVGDGTSTATLLAHAIFADGAAQRGGRRECHRPQARPRSRGEGRRRSAAPMSRPVATRKEKAQVATISAHNDPTIGETGRRRHGEGRRRRRDYGRGIENDRNDPRSRRRNAIRSRLPVALLHHQSGQDGGRARGCRRPAVRQEDQRAERYDSAARTGRQVRHARCWSSPKTSRARRSRP